jgi:hypothetical protein
MASSSVCPNQAFRIGKRVIGLQFHLETTPESLEALIHHCGDELVPGRFIQRDQEMRGVSTQRFDAIHRLMGELLDDLVKWDGMPEGHPADSADRGQTPRPLPLSAPFPVLQAHKGRLAQIPLVRLLLPAPLLYLPSPVRLEGGCRKYALLPFAKNSVRPEVTAWPTPLLTI